MVSDAVGFAAPPLEVRDAVTPAPRFATIFSAGACLSGVTFEITGLALASASGCASAAVPFGTSSEPAWAFSDGPSGTAPDGLAPEASVCGGAASGAAVPLLASRFVGGGSGDASLLASAALDGAVSAFRGGAAAT